MKARYFFGSGALVLVTTLLACGADPTTPDLGDLGPTDAPARDAGLDSHPPDSAGPDQRDSTSPDATPTTCAGCHGSAKSSAPPKSVAGKTATSLRGVGAHQQHLKSSTWRAAVPCAACHVVPKTINAKGHIDTALPAEVVFSGAAKADKATPLWNGSTCKGSYCHGATLSGGASTAPVWTKVDGSQAKCNSCHGMPPTGKNHSTSKACHMCHKAVVGQNLKIVAPKLHLDGKVTANKVHAPGWKAGTVHGPAFNDGVKTKTCLACHGNDLKGGVSGISCESCHSGWQTRCNFCHGSTTQAHGAPPATVAGSALNSKAGVGKHKNHMRKGKTHDSMDCAICHGTKPTTALTPGHIDPRPAEVKFSGFLKGASYDYKTVWCKNVYCHGNGQKSSSRNLPWVGTLSGGCMACHSGSISICSTCHDDNTDGAKMTLSGKHKRHVVDKGMSCDKCHSCTVTGNKTIVDFKKHMNGEADMCGAGWVAATKSCTPSCHVKRSW